MDGRRWLSLAATTAIAAGGGLLATLAGLPASWMCGAMIAVTAASLAGLDTRQPLRVVDVMLLALGITLGCGVTPELVNGLAAWPLSLIGLAVSVAAVVLSVRAFLVHIAGWDRDTAFFSAVPGALSYVLAVASETRADIRRVAVGQSVRIFLLVAVLPSVIVAVEAGPAEPFFRGEATIRDLALMAVAGVGFGLVFHRLKIPAGLLTGSLFGSALLQGSGVVVGDPPEIVVIAVFVLLGALIGSRFIGTSLVFLRRILIASVGAFLVATTVASAIALIVSEVTGIGLDQVLIAFAPGGLDAMTTLALALGMDSAYVAAHQLARFVGIALTLPFFARKALARGRAPVDES